MFKTRAVLLIAFFSLAFPSENEVKSRLRPGLTPEQVVTLLGEPNTGHVVPCVNCSFLYLAPIGTLTVEKEGYRGVKIWFREGKVYDWKIYTGTPSYAEPKLPVLARYYLWLLGIAVALGIIGKLLIHVTPVAAVVSRELAKAFENREIESNNLPKEFRFITRDTTLKGIIEKIGEPSRVVKIPISAERGLGYALVSSKTGRAMIITYEYDLPYHAAVIVMPEFPFEQQSRIRAVFYRPVQSKLAETT